MQHYSILKKCHSAFSSVSNNTKNQIFNLGSLKKTVSYVLFAALMIPTVVFGQSVQRPVSTDSSLAESNKNATGKTEQKETQIIESGLTTAEVVPEGSPCGWTSSVPSSIPILDQ